MKHTNLIIAALACTPLWSCSPLALGGCRSRSAAYSRKAWHVTRVDVDYGRDMGAHTVDVQPAIYMFSKNRFAITAVSGFETRPYLTDTPTDEENGRAFAPFRGSTGTPSTDAKLSITPQVTKDPAGMISPASSDYEVLWVDGKVWLTTNTPDAGRVRTELTRLDPGALKVSPEAGKLKASGAGPR